MYEYINTMHALHLYNTLISIYIQYIYKYTFSYTYIAFKNILL